MPEPHLLEHTNIIGSIFKKMIECIKTHTIYINFVESRKVHYGDYYKIGFVSDFLCYCLLI
jgi:hypothetical protein